MEAKYKIKSSVGDGYEFEGKYFTAKQAQRIADKQAKARNAVDFADKRNYWQGIVAIVTPDVSLKDETYFRINLAGK